MAASAAAAADAEHGGSAAAAPSDAEHGGSAAAAPSDWIPPKSGTEKDAAAAERNLGGAGGDVLESEIEPRSGYLQKFSLYETQSKFYMVGRNKDKSLWRVLKIDRSEPSELNIREDSTVYTESEVQDLLKRIREGNKSTGGLKFVTNCYGIVGFIKFLGPHYMLLITKRKLIGAICGHMVYAITNTAMIPLLDPSARCNFANSKDENRYKKLLCSVDLTKDFFFSYSYHVMRSLQKNLCDGQTGQFAYETMFVWNEFLTRGIRNHLKSTLWTVALVYGFFKQAELAVSGKEFVLTLIARRSRHFAGTRYLKRGVNEKGRVANDVETEQIVFEVVPGGSPTHITSVVQNRGSIPLFWSQETSRLNLKPDIKLHKKDKEYEATRLHFENLVKRYGNPIIILNLIKTREKKPRESILRAEFANAIDFINKNLSVENHLKFLHWDLNKHSRSKGTNVLLILGRVAFNVLNLTGFFHSEVPQALRFEDALNLSNFETYNPSTCCSNQHGSSTDDTDISASGSEEDNPENGDACRDKSVDNIKGNNGVCLVRPTRVQKGVLRTNCIDCLDRTNVAQYAYGLAALARQLHVLGLIDTPRIDLDNPLADNLMAFYELMGDTLALQYGGSAAHNKIFCERRGQWKAATQSQEFFRTLQRYYSNAYMDAEKQDAINLFLGHFQPEQGKPALWELDPYQHYNIGRFGFVNEDMRSIMKRSLSDGNILCESITPSSSCRVGHKKIPNSAGDAKTLSESTPEISTCQTQLSYSRFPPAMPSRQLFAESEHSYFIDHGLDNSNFLDIDWLSSSGNSCEDDVDRSNFTNSPIENLSTDDVVDIAVETPPLSEDGSSLRLGREATEDQLPYEYARGKGFSDSFVEWVINGETLCN